MKMLLLGGFLGSGKTTVLNKILRAIAGEGARAAVIENEIGSVGIDDRLLEETGVKVTPLFGGCVCCEISGDLVRAVGQIEDEVGPDWLVVEMTGLALMTDMLSVLRRYGRSTLEIHPVSVLDMARFGRMYSAMRPVLERQLQGAELVLINKADIVPPTEEDLSRIAALAPGAVCRTVSAAQMEDDMLWRCIREGAGGENE